MSGPLPPDELLEALSRRIDQLRAAGRAPDPVALSRELGLAPEVVEACLAGLEALEPPALPEGEPGPALARYALRGELGRGGMGTVYRAHDLRLGRDVAIKLLRAGAWATPTQRERFLREARAAAGLDHPHALAIHDLGETRGGGLYLVLELVEGARTFDQVAPGLTWPERVALVRDAARALGAAHARGLIHRDVKPNNLLIDRRGRVRVADFGLARAADATPLTRTGTVLGTRGYLAPEQARGQPDQHGPASDVWSLGAVLFESLTGRLPFEASGSESPVALLDGRAPPRLRELAPALPAPLEAICARALAPAPSDRYPHADALADALERVLPTSSPVVRAGPGWIAALLVAVAAGIALGRASAPGESAPLPTTDVAQQSTAPSSGRPVPVGPVAGAPLATVLHVQATSPVQVAFGPDASLITYGLAGLRRWSVPDGAPQGQWLRGRVTGAVRLTQGDWVFASAQNLVRRPILLAGQPRAAGQADWTVPVPDVSALAASPSTGTLAFGSEAGGVFVLSSQLGEPQRIRAPRAGERLAGLAFLDELRLALHWSLEGGTRSRLEVCDRSNGAALATLELPRVTCCAASPGGELLAVGHASGELALLRAESLVRERALVDPELGGASHDLAFRGAVGALAFAPAGGLLVASPGSDVLEGSVLVFDLATGAARPLTPPRSAAVASLAISPDGGHVALGGRDGRAELWPLASPAQRGRR